MSNDTAATPPRIDVTVSPTPAATTSSAPLTTFYRRSLPETCIAFSSRQGRSCFESAMRNKGLKSFFNLMEQHSTQSEVAYCGISTLVIALNALAVDPRQTWKGPWRWYEESMLNCCVDLEEAKKRGITMAIFNSLAICQGLVTEVQYVDDDAHNNVNVTATNNGEDDANSTIPTLSPLDKFRRVVQEACVESSVDTGSMDDALIDRVLISSYNRRILGQTGSGHFSPIAAYDTESDSILIMDTARFKYGAHWVKLPLLFEAMQSQDPSTNRSRGYIMLIHRKDNDTHPGLVHNLPISILLRTEMKQSRARQDFKEYLTSLERSPNYQDIASFCTQDGTNPNKVWEMTQPQLHPIKDDEDSKQMVDEVQALIQQLLLMRKGSPCSIRIEHGDDNETGAQCRSRRCRAIHVRRDEAIFIMYLACLDENERIAVVFDRTYTASDRARRQLLAEAKLYRYAIDTSDQMPQPTSGDWSCTPTT